MKTSKRLVILEGPDGAGKTTLANELVAKGFHYHHCGPYRGVTSGLPRLYVEAMLPTLLGLSDVVMDRSWLSEPVYGPVYRGASRLDAVAIRMLERLAMRCETVVVLCQPTLQAVLQSFRRRKGQEMLDSEAQLTDVYRRYTQLTTALPTVKYDYELMTPEALIDDLEGAATIAHPLNFRTAGNKTARAALIGEAFAAHKPDDPGYQWPFASFADQGCSRWLTQQLENAGIPENQLFWFNADQPVDEIIKLIPDCHLVALGEKAAARVSPLRYDRFSRPHPQYWKRFRSDEMYPLIPLLETLINE